MCRSACPRPSPQWWTGTRCGRATLTCNAAAAVVARVQELVQRHEGDLLTEEEQEPYNRWAEAMRRLYAAILHLDDTMMLMHDL